MFIAVNIDLASDDSKNNIRRILREFGLKKIMPNLYESFEFHPNQLGNFKRDILNNVDIYDKLRLYQFPLEETFKISYLDSKKWKRLSINRTKSVFALKWMWKDIYRIGASAWKAWHCVLAPKPRKWVGHLPRANSTPMIAESSTLP